MKKWLSLLFFVLFMVIFIMYLTGNVVNIDNFFYNIIISFKNDNVTLFMKFITFLASSCFAIFTIFLFFILYYVNKNKIYIILNKILLGEIILNNIIKILVRRDRPTTINLVTEKTYSFPSGHTMFSVTLFGFLIYLILISQMKKKYKVLLIMFSLVINILILISRIYLGAHYFSDVISGVFLALSYLFYCIDFVERKRNNESIDYRS